MMKETFIGFTSFGNCKCKYTRHKIDKRYDEIFKNLCLINKEK